MIIDTNIYVALYNGEKPVIDALKSAPIIVVPIMVVAELRYGFMYGNKQQDNATKLDMFLAQEKVEIIYPTLQTAQIFGELLVYCRRVGRALSHNDLWVAALAREQNLPLVTRDKDFAVFSEMFGKNLIIVE